MPTVSTLSRLTFALVAATWALLVFGASVRVHGAGLACPDWPLCFGEVIPEIDVGVAFEFGHRVIAGLISLAFLGLAGAVFTRRGETGPAPLRIIAAAAVVLAVQIVLGGLTVLELLAEWTVTSHLIAGNTFCMLLLVLALALREAAAPVRRPEVSWASRGLAVVMAVVVPAQVALGGLVASSYAGLACGTWPTCDGTTWFPTFEGLVGLQLAHRVVAYVLLATALAAAVGSRGPGARVARALFGVVVVQAALGVANVWLRLPVEVTLLHSAGAAASFMGTAWLNWEVWRAPVAAFGPAVAAPAAAALEGR
jgi:cytochrome c oxidase assembly protein subunit 15